MSRKREIAPKGICPIDGRYMRRIADTVSPYFEGRRCELYRCTCGREIPFWTPSWSIERGFVTELVPDDAPILEKT